MKEEILAKLQELGNDDLPAIDFAAERSVQMMKAYCNISEVPMELCGVGVSIAKQILESNMFGTQAKSIQEGDVSVTFATDVNKEDMQKVLHGFHTELDRFRTMQW